MYVSKRSFHNNYFNKHDNIEIRIIQNPDNSFNLVYVVTLEQGLIQMSELTINIIIIN